MRKEPMKYRIREDINNKGESTFIPELKRSFIRGWEEYGRYFNLLIDARMFISNRKDRDIKGG